MLLKWVFADFEIGLANLGDVLDGFEMDATYLSKGFDDFEAKF